MISDRQIVERRWRETVLPLGIGSTAALAVIAYAAFHYLTGLGAPLAEGVLTFSFLFLPFAAGFYLFLRLIRWIVWGLVRDKERRGG